MSSDSDARQCSEPKDADVFAMSAHKKDQRAERQNFQEKGNRPKSDYVCYRCDRRGKHYQNE